MLPPPLFHARRVVKMGALAVLVLLLLLLILSNFGFALGISNYSNASNCSSCNFTDEKRGVPAGANPLHNR
ncbi:hypothetical protein LOK49_LG04G03174 [Camellia lanceoleosa]|uniref:Uncharacterized protein n=1 Tax=Camellia lanceoleosa TaxID=1840588 RepID=A0ACC0HYK3_9ERIC|nr:hypothetical protein LOK49_LG04G03174 [Camellia lanceoleosa]